MNKSESELAGDLFDAMIQPGGNSLEEIGIKVGKLYTAHGLPIDMALERLNGYTKDEKLAIVNGACEWFIQHKRDSGATERSIKRQQQANRKMVDRFIATGEVNIY